MRCLILLNTYKKQAFSLAESIEDFLQKRSVTVDKLEFAEPLENFSFEPYDFAITLGGDGTVLFAARGCLDKRIPIFPINLGEFGFIAGVQKDKWQEPLEQFLHDELALAARSMLKVDVRRGNKTIFSEYALNDVVIAVDKAAKPGVFDIKYNQNAFGQFRADGLIIATSTGSTAYSAAAGGPIVDPELDAIVFNPICAFSLSNRPLVLPSTAVLQIEILPARGAPVAVTADGQVSERLETGDIVIIQKTKEKVLLAGCGSAVFYSALRSKLHWSGGPLA
ncbi:MAG: NAD(+)/NADH kinase [Treponemataceae bacterium]|nr:NAD(+)/NADH kinase [Treponemataceae bacterium]